MNKFCVVLLFFLSICSNAFSVEFFFTSSPAGKGKALNKLKFSNPVTGLSHTALYLSEACYDKSQKQKPNLIRLCNKNDQEKGLVVSFDFTLQNELNLFFMALKRSEFFYGTFKKGKLPSTLSKNEIKEMDFSLIEKYSYLKNREIFKRQSKRLSEIGLKESLLDKILDELIDKGPSKKNLNVILDNFNIELNSINRKKVLKVANYIFKKKITKRGLSRRSVSWGLSYYKSIWSVRYPTTRKEEALIIDYINSEWSNKRANLVSYNCVTPIMAIARILFNERPKRPSLVSLPYPLLKKVVSKVFKRQGQRRKNSFMKFYPKLETQMPKNSYPFPTTFKHESKMVRFYKNYQGLYNNNITFDLSLLKTKGKIVSPEKLNDLYNRRKIIFKMEKNLNLLLNNFDNDQIKNRGVVWNKILKIKSLKQKVGVHYKRYKNKYSSLNSD